MDLSSENYLMEIFSICQSAIENKNQNNYKYYY